MEHDNIADYEGTIHGGLFNTHTGSLVDLSCGAGPLRVHSGLLLGVPRRTDAALTCASCIEVAAAGSLAAWSWENLSRAHAEAVLALADREGCVPEIGYEWLQQAFERLKLASPPRSEMYGVIREHLAEMLTQRALAWPPGTPTVWVQYNRFTGGMMLAPISVGDRLVRCWFATGGRDARGGRRGRGQG